MKCESVLEKQALLSNATKKNQLNNQFRITISALRIDFKTIVTVVKTQLL